LYSGFGYLEHIHAVNGWKAIGMTHLPLAVKEIIDIVWCNNKKIPALIYTSRYKIMMQISKDKTT